MNVLVINCGSSSLKFQLIDVETERLIAKGICDRIGIDGSQLAYAPTGKDKIKKNIDMPDHKVAISIVLSVLSDKETGVVKDLNEIGAIGHRVVHGGEKFAEPIVINDEVLRTIEECSDLAPLHNPANLIGIYACKELMPNTPMTAIFDTAFHQTMPESAYLYGIPYEYYKKYKIRKYGFHGTSHSYVSKRVAAVLDVPYDKLKIIVCHLGNGSSVSAVKYGKCIDTSMGLTPLEGLIMGTRCGDLDPAIIEQICQREHKTVEEVMDILNKKSGVYGISDGFSSDFRDLEDEYILGRVEAVRALDAFDYRVVKYIGQYAAAMDGVDAICFTAGIGENSPILRSLICKSLTFLGIEINEEANNKRGEEIVISSNTTGTKVLVIPTNEELAIARDTYQLLK